MRLLELSSRSEKGVINIAPKDRSGENWITIITGANGTRKSIILRLISAAAIGATGVKLPGLSFTLLKIKAIDAEKINRVIAISGTPFDRFLKSNYREIISANGKDETEPAYTYFGFKSVNGATGSVGISRIIGSLLWKRRHVLPNRNVALSKIFKFLALNPNVEVKLRRAPALNSTSRTSNIEGLKRGDFDPSQLGPFLTTLSDNYEEEGETELHAYTRFLLRSKARLAKLSKFLSQFPTSVRYDFAEGQFTPAFEINEEFDIERLSEIGILAIEDLFVERPAGLNNEAAKRMSASSLSSGQWQLLLGLLGLGLEVQDNTTILIDEPENSLHPEWQRQYIELLESVIADKKGCHAIIATHSPLITSGVNGQHGNIIRLVPNNETLFGVTAEPLIQNFGWDVNKTLELLFGMQTTRGSTFVEMVDNALALVRDQKTESDEFINLATSIATASENLPKGDPMLQLSFAIVNLLPQKKAV